MGAEAEVGADALRFPYFPPLLHALVRPLASGLPPQWWLGLGIGLGLGLGLGLWSGSALGLGLRHDPG